VSSDKDANSSDVYPLSLSLYPASSDALQLSLDEERTTRDAIRATALRSCPVNGGKRVWSAGFSPSFTEQTG